MIDVQQVHAYKRSNRVFNYTLDACGPVYISVGHGGNREKMATTHADDPGHCPDPASTPNPFIGGRLCATNFTTGPAAGRFCWDRQPDYSAYRESSFGHGVLEVKNDTHALWRWHRNQDLNADVAADEVYIVREPDKCLGDGVGVFCVSYLAWEPDKYTEREGSERAAEPPPVSRAGAGGAAVTQMVVGLALGWPWKR